MPIGDFIQRKGSFFKMTIPAKKIWPFSGVGVLPSETLITSDTIPDLFAGVPPAASPRREHREQPAELKRALACVRLMKRTADPLEKKKYVHLVCENLKALCKRSARGIR